MLVIYEGTVKVELEVDSAYTIILDYLGKGSIIRPHHFLVNRCNMIKYKAVDQVLIYSLKLETLAILCLEYEQLRESVKDTII